MAKITDQDYMTACANGDGTFDGRKAVRWLTEALGGKPMTQEEADDLIKEVLARKKAEKATKNGA